MSSAKETSENQLWKISKEINDSKNKAKSARREGDRVTGIFNEGRIAGLISAAKIIQEKL